MAYTVKISDRLLPKCAYIRKAVFMEEQGFQQEFDEIDDRAYHALILDGETPAAVGRLYTKDGKTYIIGRIAVMPSYRGKHLGERVVTALEEQAKACGAASIALSHSAVWQAFMKSWAIPRRMIFTWTSFVPM